MGGKANGIERLLQRSTGESLFGEARSRGKVIGELQGEARLGVLINRLILDGRSAEVQGAATDAEKRERTL